MLGNRWRTDTQLAACMDHPALNKGMSDIPTAPWTFFHLPKYHEPVRPWAVATYHWCLSSCYPGAGAQRKWVWVTESVCGLLKRDCLRLQKFLPLTQSLLVFASRSSGDLSSWHWNPGMGGLVWGWDSSLPRYQPGIFIQHMWMWGQPILHLCASYQSGWMWFL